MATPVLVHAGSYVNSDICGDTKRRLAKAKELIDSKQANYIVIDALWGTMQTEQGERNGDAKLGMFMDMHSYAMNIGIPSELIIGGAIARDTVGEAYFMKALFSRNQAYSFITSEWQAPRAAKIHQVLNPQLESTLFTVPDAYDFKCIKEREQKSLEAFLQQMGPCMGDNKKIEEAIYSQHVLYKNLPPEQRLLVAS
jgi:hypothetical protein